MDQDDINNNEEVVIDDEELESENESSSEEVMGSDAGSDAEEDPENLEESGARKRVFIPGQKLPKGTQLVPDESAYIMRQEFGFHPLPSSLSFDYIYGVDPASASQDYPQTSYIATGTQAPGGNKNRLIFAKLSNVHQHEEGDDDDGSEDEDEDSRDAKEAVLQRCTLKHKGGVNRVRCQGGYMAAFGEKKTVTIYNCEDAIKALNDVNLKRAWMVAEKQKRDPLKPTQIFTGHREEGYALAWSSGMSLLSGDCKAAIHYWKPAESGWLVDQIPFGGHGDSVEDIQWQPKSDTTFCSVSCDLSMKVWDVRQGHNALLTVPDAHEKDINVMSWSAVDTNFILTGGDDCAIKIWDTRKVQETNGSAAPLAVIKHHTKPITSIEWHPTEDGVFVASGEDDQVTIWDFGLETHSTDGDQDLGELGIPQQLLFIHAGHQEYKEVHWDQEKPGTLLTTAGTNFSVFRTISV